MESPSYDCMHAFTTNINELDSSSHKVKNDGWRASNSLKYEEWIIVSFGKNVDLHTVHYHPLNKSQYKAKKITFLIGNQQSILGTEMITHVLEKGKWNFDIKPTRIMSMKVILSGSQFL